MRNDEINIISRRDIEPLLAKARQVLRYYDKAMDCGAVVLDRSGYAIKNADYYRQMRFCQFCKKYSQTAPNLQKTHDYPCGNMHFDALAESRRKRGAGGGGAYIYACAVGFAYWTSPLYRNGRYVGALTAGQILSCKHDSAAEKFYTLCKDNIVKEKFLGMIEDVPEKSPEDIQSMAQLLGICAEAISESKKVHADGMGRLTRPLENVDWNHSLEKERTLLAAFRRGDNETGSRIIKELMDSTLKAVPDNLEILRFRAMELFVLLSRAAVPSEAADDSLFEANNRYLKRIQESKTPAELIENLHIIGERMAARIFSYRGVRHASVLRKAERYIWENYSRKLSLEEIAKASGLSAPYFSTVFKEEMGENLSCYLNRLRVKKAAVLLRETGKLLHEIAGLCGFEDQSWFSKIFKSYTGISPGKYRKTGGALCCGDDI